MTKKITKPGFIPLEKGVNCNSRPSGPIRDIISNGTSSVQSLSLQPVRKRGSLKGFTLIELMVAVLLVAVGTVGIGMVIADAHKGYSRMFDRIEGQIIQDSYAARLKFDKVCRMTMAGSAVINGSSNPSLLVLYYSSPNVNGDADALPDSYAEFYLNNTDLMLNTGAYDPNTGTTGPPATETVAGNVTKLEFSATDVKSVQMIMTLDEDGNPDVDDGYSLTITCGSVMHNPFPKL